MAAGGLLLGVGWLVLLRRAAVLALDCILLLLAGTLLFLTLVICPNDQCGLRLLLSRRSKSLLQFDSVGMVS